jgi:hypothetical protein
MPNEKKQTNYADILRDVGFALYPDVDWQARLAKAMGKTKEDIRGWQRDRSPLNDPDSPIFDELLELADKRVDEITKARDRLREWLRTNRK